MSQGSELREFVECVEQYLDGEFAVDLNIMLMTKSDRSEGERLAKEISAQKEKTLPVVCRLRDLGRSLATRLAAVDAELILRIVQSTEKGGGGNERTQSLWQDIKPRLELLVLAEPPPISKELTPETHAASHADETARLLPLLADETARLLPLLDDIDKRRLASLRKRLRTVPDDIGRLISWRNGLFSTVHHTSDCDVLAVYWLWGKTKKEIP